MTAKLHAEASGSALAATDLLIEKQYIVNTVFNRWRNSGVVEVKMVVCSHFPLS